MAGLFGVLLMACAAIAAAAGAIHFFWQLSYRRALAYAGLFIGVFLIFWLSGLWEGASRHSWGVLAPIFALILCGVWLLARYLPGLATHICKKIKEKR